MWQLLDCLHHTELVSQIILYCQAQPQLSGQSKADLGFFLLNTTTHWIKRLYHPGLPVVKTMTEPGNYAGQIMECAGEGYLGTELANCVENIIGGCHDCIPCYTCLCQVIQWLGLGIC